MGPKALKKDSSAVPSLQNVVNVNWLLVFLVDVNLVPLKCHMSFSFILYQIMHTNTCLTLKTLRLQCWWFKSCQNECSLYSLVPHIIMKPCYPVAFFHRTVLQGLWNDMKFFRLEKHKTIKKPQCIDNRCHRGVFSG